MHDVNNSAEVHLQLIIRDRRQNNAAYAPSTVAAYAC